MDQFQWNVRVCETGRGRATAYVRRHRFEVGAPVQFDPQYPLVTALEYVLGALGADVVNGLQAVARRRRVVLDHVEAAVAGRLNNALTHLGVVGEEGHPGLEEVTVRVYVSSTETEEAVKEIWQEVRAKSPLVRTFERCVRLDCSVKAVL